MATNPPHVPGHVAIIMDGNGRWARSRGLPRLEGHRRGAARARQVVEWAADAGVRCISLFAFSTENWARPPREVRGLMSLLTTMLPREVPAMNENGVRLRVLGDVAALPARARRALDDAMEATKRNARIDLVLCLNYGGRQEILEGVRAVCRRVLASDDPEAALKELDAEGFREALWCARLPSVDLLIRTGGERRISNFYLWDAAYAELYFSDRFWPDFSREDFQAALDDYARRERRFGRTSEQVQRRGGR